MINNLKCKYCTCDRINKSGFVNNGNQRYLCRGCKRTFTITERKYDDSFKLKIIKIYLEGVGIRSIERIEGVHNSVISKWIKKMGNIVKEQLEKIKNTIPDNIKKEDIEILEGDEIVTYIKKNSKMEDKTSGYGFLLTEEGIKLLIFK